MKIITSKLSKRITTVRTSQWKITAYDKDNKYPQNLRMICDGSGTATACIRIHSKFIRGKGFVQNGDKVVNNKRGYTLDDILRSVSNDYAYFRGWALHVNYNANFKVSSITHVPFEHCRLGYIDDTGYAGKIAVYNNWDYNLRKNIEKAKIDYIDRFNPDPEIIAYQVKQAGGWQHYKGQILWHSDDGEYTYPKGAFDPVLEDVETDGQLKTYKYRSVVNKFSAGHMFVHKGTFASDEDRDKFIKGLNEFQGTENAGSIFLVEVDIDEQVPEIKDFK